MSALLGAATFGHDVEHLGAIVAVLLAGVVVLDVDAGRRALALLGALILTPVLLVASIWSTSQMHPFRAHPLFGVVAVIVGLGAVIVLGQVMRRYPQTLPLLAMAALPFRLPISGETSNGGLLIPLYLVVGAGGVAYAVQLLRSPDDGRPRVSVGWLERLLMGFALLYAVQALYTISFDAALKEIVFFYVPFALLFALLRQVQWDQQVLLRCLGVLVALSVVFVLVGFYEYHRRKLLLNPSTISADEIESYFRVNSLFYDPNIYGRFLAMVMLALTVLMLWARRQRDVLLALAALLLLWAGLMTSISQSSIVALLLGLAVIAALRWSVRQTLRIAALLVVAGAVFLLVAGSAVHFNLSNSHSADNSTGGRYTLVKGGLDLFSERPVLGYGSGSFEAQYKRHRASSSDDAVSASHTIPITIAAEQGIIGLLLYLVLLVACFGRLFGGDVARSPARIAIAAAFAGLVLHTMLYADFLEDPITWTLLGVGTSLRKR